MSRIQTLKDRAPIALSFLVIAMAISGTNGCQEDYDMGSRSSVKDTTGTPTPTPTDDGDDELVTPTPTGTGTVGATPTPVLTETAEPTETPSSTGTAGTLTSAGSDFLTELSLLSTPKPGQVQKPGATGQNGINENWLGKAFSKKREKRDFTDIDRDGYADWLEEEMGTDANDPNSRPNLRTTKLTDRLRGDDDLDGLSNTEEKASGWDPLKVDTDGDGKADGAEVISDGNPGDPNDSYLDSDGDGLGDPFEVRKELNSVDPDTDGDGLPDDKDLALCDAKKADTDHDGISDLVEYETGGDCHTPDIQ